MAQVQVPDVLLNSGNKMPMIGFGTSSVPLPPKDELISTFLDAIEVGYRHFDTAKLYDTEEMIGEAIMIALDHGLIKSRHELFITSKLWCTDTHPDLVLPALQASLKRLGMSYVDLYLIHMPARLKPGTDIYRGFPKSDILTFDIKGTWKAMESCFHLGLAKSIGVSNFGWKKLSQILEVATIPPSVDQVEMHVAWQQKKLVEFCKEKGIHVTAWAPLGAHGTSYGSAVMQSPVLNSIATTKQKTLAQVALRWIHEQGVTVIPKSFNKDRMKQNLEIFDWELTEEDMAPIQQILQKRGFFEFVEMYINPDGGQYKSLEEFWDEEE